MDFGDDVYMKETVSAPTPNIDSSQLQSLIIETAKRFFAVRNTGEIKQKQDGSLVTQVDIELQDAITSILQHKWPEIPLLGEEMGQVDQRRLMSSDAFWCLDPLDGTTNFANEIPFFAISLALVRGGKVVTGVVYDPMHNECFRADLGAGAWLNDQPLRLQRKNQLLRECVALVDFERLPKTLMYKIAEQSPYRSQRSLGAVALEWCWLAAGRAQLYLHGAQKIWDYAAGLLIFKEAGGCGCIMDLISGDCLEIDREIEAHAAIGASEEVLLRQWKEWLYAADSD